MIALFKFKRAPSVMGLALDGNRLEAVVLRRSNGSLRVGPTVSASLALSPLTDAPELVGREIRNHLDQARIRERRCAVCLPLTWVLTLQTKLPELSEADLASFLQLEAERGFHSEDLLTARSIFKTPAGDSYATILAVPRNNINTLERVLRAAKLKPVTFGLGAASVQGGEGGRLITLVLRSNSIDLQISGGGGIIALRSLDGGGETEGAQRRISPEFVAREIRITLGQLPGGFAEGPGPIKIFGQGETARQFVNEISPRLVAMGLTPELVERASAAQFDKPLPPEIAVSPMVALAATWLRGGASTLEFLPPRVQAWQRWIGSGLSKRRLIWAAEAAAGLVLCVIIAFGLQQWQIASLKAKWNAMAPTVTALNSDQDQIQKFRAWYDRSFRDLRIWRELTYAFPDDGDVHVRTIEIRDLNNVTCSGMAQDNASFVRVHDKLGSDTNEVSNLHAEVRGQKPMQFTLNFQWEGAPTDGK